MRDLLFFDNMITPRIITLVYWLLLVTVVVMGLGVAFSQGVSFSSLFAGILYMVGGAVAARIWCELLIVLFKMNEALQEIRNK